MKQRSSLSENEKGKIKAFKESGVLKSHLDVQKIFLIEISQEAANYTIGLCIRNFSVSKCFSLNTKVSKLHIFICGILD